MTMTKRSTNVGVQKKAGVKVRREGDIEKKSKKYHIVSSPYKASRRKVNIRSENQILFSSVKVIVCFRCSYQKKG